MVNRVCWNCGAISQMKPLRINGSRDWYLPLDEAGEHYGPFLFSIYACTSCGYPNIARREWHPEPVGHGGPPEIIPGEFVEWIPSEAQGHRFPGDVPDEIASTANEAYRCFSVQCYRASAMMARTVVESIINEQIGHEERFRKSRNGEERDKGLKEKLDIAVSKEYISKRTGQKADSIKNLGDSSTHFTVEDISESDASDTLDLMVSVIEDVYVHAAERYRMDRKAEEMRTKEKKGKATSRLGHIKLSLRCR